MTVLHLPSSASKFAAGRRMSYWKWELKFMVPMELFCSRCCDGSGGLCGENRRRKMILEKIFSFFAVGILLDYTVIHGGTGKRP